MLALGGNNRVPLCRIFSDLANHIYMNILGKIYYLIKASYIFAMGNDWLETNPMAGLSSPKKHKINVAPRH